MLRLISYLAPSIPRGFFEVAATAMSEGASLDVDLRFDQLISGPLAGDPNPFRDGTADVGFVCSPTYHWMRDELTLLPLPVPLDKRADGRPVYFADVIVHAASAFTTLADLRGARWAYNDRNSRSGWLSLVDTLAPLAPEEFFKELRHAGSHLESLRLVRERAVDAAAIDSNVLVNVLEREPGIAATLRTIETWGPFPIQPIVIRNDVPASIRAAVRTALLRAHEVYGRELRSYGFERFVDANDWEYHCGSDEDGP